MDRLQGEIQECKAQVGALHGLFDAVLHPLTPDAPTPLAVECASPMGGWLREQFDMVSQMRRYVEEIGNACEL